MTVEEPKGGGTDVLWDGLEEFSNPEDLDEREYLLEVAEKHEVTPTQAAKVFIAVCGGTYIPSNYRDPLWRDKLYSVAEEIGVEKTIHIIGEYFKAEFEEGGESQFSNGAITNHCRGTSQKGNR
jgi:hypothetical protein